MVDPGTLTGLNALGDAVAALQKSARQTIPMFIVGILATLIAAGVALYYILTLSADLREARQALRQSEMALSQARENLADVSRGLQAAQKTKSPPADTSALASAISSVSRSQLDISAAASSIRDAKAKLTPAIVAPEEFRQIAGTCRLQVGSVTYLAGNCEIELARGGSFRIYTVGRAGPSAQVRREGPVGNGSWRPAPDREAIGLGELQRHGACWSNDAATICAWDFRR